MQGFERRWLLETSWKLQVQEGEEGWSVRETDGEDASSESPPRWSDGTGAFGAASVEFRLEGRSGTWDLRVYERLKVASAAQVPGGRIRLPEGWWMASGEERSPSALGFGAPGTSVEDLERGERRGWEAWIPSADGDVGPAATFAIVGNWHRVDERHGDTAILNRMAPIGGEAFLRDRLRGRPGSPLLALDCRDLVEATDTEDGLADGFLFAHQAFGARWLCWDAPPSAVVAKALERAHMDAQGELFGVWVARGGEAVPARAPWRRLGPVLRPCEGVPDCYVWQR